MQSFFILLFAILVPLKSYAQIAQSFGLGSESSSKAGAQIANTTPNSFSSWENPAALSWSSQKRYGISAGILGIWTSVPAIQDVIVENNYTSDKDPPRVGNVRTQIKPVLGQILGGYAQPLPKLWNLSFGAALYLPMPNLASLDSGETYLPEYVLLKSRNQRPHFFTGISVKPLDFLSVGIGTQLGFTVTSTASVFLKAIESKPSTMRFNASMKPITSPYFGALAQWDPISIGAIVRLPLRSKNEMTLKTGAQTFGEYAALDFVFDASSAFFDDPMSFEIGTKIREWNFGSTSAQVEYQKFGDFLSPTLKLTPAKLTRCEGAECGLPISGSQLPSLSLRNRWVIRVGQEIQITNSDQINLGYSFRQGIFSELPKGRGNFLDPSQNILTLGYGHEWKNFLNSETDLKIQTHLAYHSLQKSKVTKNNSDDLGAPGYPIGGSQYGGGLSVGLLW